MWILPALIVGLTIALSIPLGMFVAWVMDGRRRVPALLGWIEHSVDTGPQDWKRYSIAGVAAHFTRKTTNARTKTGASHLAALLGAAEMR